MPRRHELTDLLPKPLTIQMRFASFARNSRRRLASNRVAVERSKNALAKRMYKHRNQIEHFFGRIKRCRRVASCYEKKAVNFAALIVDMI